VSSDTTSHSTSPATPSVIIADDDKGICTVLHQALTRKGYRTSITHDGAELIQWASQGQGDLIITDVIMPRMNGLDALTHIREHRPHLPVIVISAKSTLNMAIDATARGAQEYFPKPFDLHTLVACVERLLPQRPIHEQTTPSTQIHLTPEISIPLIGSSPAMQRTFRTIARLIPIDLTVLLRGESGTGKEVIARAIHSMGKRKEHPFIALNMAAIPKDLIESELFGHEKGAFTGANQARRGAFAQAEGGTLFLDEIGDMPIEAQTRLLRVIQESEYVPVGSNKPLPCDVRIICATHHDLEQLCQRKLFREDLYYRLNVVPITIPPLRERQDDITALADFFLQRAHTRGLPLKSIEHSAIELLKTFDWKGNVRELENNIYRLCALCPDDTITVHSIEEHLIKHQASGKITSETFNQQHNFQNISSMASHALQQYFYAHKNTSPPKELYDKVMAILEEPLLRETLQHTQGNQLRAAEILGINRNTLRSRLRALNIDINKLQTPHTPESEPIS
jgi:two-component system, NtrC family, nitrogen regulation response regulator GlnG